MSGWETAEWERNGLAQNGETGFGRSEVKRYGRDEARKALKEGLRFVSPIYEKPSRGYPFRAIIEASGVPGGPEGKGRLTRKRFRRLVMSTGNGRRAADFLAWAAHQGGISYRECLQRVMVPAILRSDKAMEAMQENIREINGRK